MVAYKEVRINRASHGSNFWSRHFYITEFGFVYVCWFGHPAPAPWLLGSDSKKETNSNPDVACEPF